MASSNVPASNSINAPSAGLIKAAVAGTGLTIGAAAVISPSSATVFGAEIQNTGEVGACIEEMLASGGLVAYCGVVALACIVLVAFAIPAYDT
ncbi:hypothetical protein Tco_0686145 [Tanacetum coccineum]